MLSTEINSRDLPEYHRLGPHKGEYGDWGDLFGRRFLSFKSNYDNNTPEESIPLVYFETLCLKDNTEYLYRKIRAELISQFYVERIKGRTQQESSAEQVPQRSSFVCAGAAVYPGGQQDEMIPMPTWTKALYIDPF